MADRPIIFSAPMIRALLVMVCSRNGEAAIIQRNPRADAGAAHPRQRACSVIRSASQSVAARSLAGSLRV